jgi:NAD(P)-dependent dehydrogenase (short-subunit alcohol dehydrogenase family)
MSGRLEGKVALVTGAGGSAIGRATTDLFAAEGAVVICADRPKDAEAGREQAERLAAGGHQAQAVVVDVMDDSSVRAALESAIAELGRLDVLFNLMVAGRTVAPDDWQWTLSSPFAPIYFGTFYGAELMSRHGGGSIINASSISGVVLSPSIAPLPPLGNDEEPMPASIGQGSYGAAKATVHHYTKEMAVRYARRGVRVNTVAPGFMQTPFTLRSIHGEYRERLEETIPMGHMGHAEDVAGAALYFASDESRYVTGQLIVVDGGFSARTSR